MDAILEVKQDMVILLTGSTGYLGRRLHGRLSGLGYKVVPFLRNENPEEVVDANRPDVIIHCATCYGRNSESLAEIREANVLVPERIVRAAIKSHARAFINTGTVLPPSTNVYAQTKFEFEQFLRTATDLPTRINLQFEQFFGPGDHGNLLPTFLIRKLIADAPSIPLTPGLQKRHFLYIDDAVDAYRVVLSRLQQIGSGFHALQVSTEESVTIHDFACLAKAVANNTVTKLDFGAVPYRSHELMDSITDISEIKKLGWAPKTSLLEALTKTFTEERKHEIPD